MEDIMKECWNFYFTKSTNYAVNEGNFPAN